MGVPLFFFFYSGHVSVVIRGAWSQLAAKWFSFGIVAIYEMCFALRPSLCLGHCDLTFQLSFSEDFCKTTTLYCILWTCVTKNHVSDVPCQNRIPNMIKTRIRMKTSVLEILNMMNMLQRDVCCFVFYLFHSRLIPLTDTSAGNDILTKATVTIYATGVLTCYNQVN